MKKRSLASATSKTSEKPNPEGGGAGAIVASVTPPASSGARSDVAEQPAEMLTYIGLSRKTGIRVATLYGMVCRNEIPHYRLAPRIVRFSASEIASWMASRHQPGRRESA
jgi:predicted DNA-binding transcriptional regulator AlpA